MQNSELYVRQTHIDALGRISPSPAHVGAIQCGTIASGFRGVDRIVKELAALEDGQADMSITGSAPGNPDVRRWNTCRKQANWKLTCRGNRNHSTQDGWIRRIILPKNNIRVGTCIFP